MSNLAGTLCTPDPHPALVSLYLSLSVAPLISQPISGSLSLSMASLTFSPPEALHLPQPISGCPLSVTFSLLMALSYPSLSVSTPSLSALPLSQPINGFSLSQPFSGSSPIGAYQGLSASQWLLHYPSLSRPLPCLGLLAAPLSWPISGFSSLA